MDGWLNVISYVAVITYLCPNTNVDFNQDELDISKLKL